MSSKVTSFLTGSLIVPIALAGVCSISGCSDDTHKTGTSVTKPPGAVEAEKKSMEGMKAIMKDMAKKRR
jgi:hypothetical protein